MTGFLLGGTTAELVLVNVNEEDERRLHIYAFDDDSWALRSEATLRPEVLFVDVANIDGRDRLITYEDGRLNWFDPESATVHPLVAVASNAPPPSDEIPHLDVTHDLNGDNRDDLVVPDSDGVWVFIQMKDGTFADPVKIGTSVEIDRIYAVDGYRYNPWTEARIHEIDYDQDGRSDLVFWNEDHFVVHRQDERGLFFPVAKTFTTEVAFDSDDLGSLVAPEGVRGRRFDHGAPGAMTGRGTAQIDRHEPRWYRRSLNFFVASRKKWFSRADLRAVEYALQLRGTLRQADAQRHCIWDGGRHDDSVRRYPV